MSLICSDSSLNHGLFPCLWLTIANLLNFTSGLYAKKGMQGKSTQNQTACVVYKSLNFYWPPRLSVLSHRFTGIIWWVLFFFQILFYLFFYFTILYWFCHTSTWIHHRCTHVPNPEPPSHLPPHTISLGHPSAPTPSILCPASNLDWRFVSYISGGFWFTSFSRSPTSLIRSKCKWGHHQKPLPNSWKYSWNFLSKQ